jgi:hypothetical protein
MPQDDLLQRLESDRRLFEMSERTWQVASCTLIVLMVVGGYGGVLFHEFIAPWMIQREIVTQQATESILHAIVLMLSVVWLVFMLVANLRLFQLQRLTKDDEPQQKVTR